jgi:hypothetical protein
MIRLPVVTKGRIAAAFTVAIIADLLQLPITLALLGSILSGLGLALALPIEAVDIMIDIATALIEVGLLGFHWMLLPTIFLEAVPGIDLAPTWTLCVWWVVRRRTRTPPNVVDVKAV